MAKTVTLRIDDETYRTFTRQAEAERRSLGKFIEMAALQYSKEAAFADEDEMNEILADRGLVRRIRQGTADAAARRGKFVA